MKTKLILASASPRRSLILRDAGFDFEILAIDVDESFPATMHLEDVPLFLAKKKMAVAKKYTPSDAVTITADTVVILGDEIINKPVDAEDAAGMLRKLSGKMHVVISGICIAYGEKEFMIADRTNVYFEELNEEEIMYYLHTCQPFDKAGAYAIQEWIGLNKISKIEGNYFNVVGFPMSRVYKILVDLGC